MKNLENPTTKKAAQALQSAFASGTEAEIATAFESFTGAVSQSIREEYEASNGDASILQSRGHRVLTSEERAFYQAWIDNAKSLNPQQAFDAALNAIPTTIIEDVFTNLTRQHPLLDEINFVNAGYATKWILNDHTATNAAWGTVTSAITQQISSSFKAIDLTQAKLSAFAVIPMDLIDLGIEWMDSYVRAILGESFASALEAAVVTGTGKNMPIGLDRNISTSASVVDGVYPQKSLVAASSFDAASFGALVSQMAQTEGGFYREISEVLLICNPVDHYTKIMPASTVLNGVGAYINNVFPVPTKVVESAALPTGEAILCLPKEYTLAMASAKSGAVSYDDSVKFIEDARTYKIKGFANGRAWDNTSALRLNITNLAPLYIPVKEIVEA